MRFGYFDEINKEYVIDKPNTPAPWVNYLGSPLYGAIISNNAGGYSFEKSGANGRILRYVFNSFDQPGRYIYIRDNKSKDYWSATWQPVAKPLDTYKSECRHGTGYSRMKAEYSGIESEVLYLVPLDKKYEVWKAKITNKSDEERDLTVSGYAEFTNNNNYEQDQVNLQYTLFITRTYFNTNRIRQVINENVKNNSVNGDAATDRFFGLAGSPVISYTGDKEKFLGSYRGYGNPEGIENGTLGNTLNYNGNACGALSTVITLKPGESKEIAFILGQKDDAEAGEIMDKYHEPGVQAEVDYAELVKYWHEKLSHLQVNTPCKEFDQMVNTWNAYQCFMTFIWSRAASFIYCGQRNGYGYRDTVQDIQGVIHLAPEMAKEQITFMLSAQVSNGGGLPLVKYTHNPGHEDTPDDASYVKETGHPAYRADDALWLFPTVYKYIVETGDMKYVNEMIPYADKDRDSVYDHLKRAIEFSMNRLGDHDMPAGLHADWNDCLRLGKKGESTFVAMQLYMAFSIISKFAEYKDDTEYLAYVSREKRDLGKVLNELCWEDDRFIRGFTEKGQVIGSKNDPEASMWLNPQSWSVISGLATKEQAEAALESVHRELATENGAMLMAPAYRNNAFDGALMLLFNASTKENGGIFSQPQGWLILAEALMGHGNRAMEYYLDCAPSAMNDKAEIRKLEPYCHGQFTEGKDSPYFGRAHVHWLTGTASTVMVGSVEGILGLRPEFNGIRISPSIPSDWKGFEMKKFFRGKWLNIKVVNDNGSESGVASITLNGEEIQGDFIMADRLQDTNDIIVKLV